jgi:hypothetical protein
MRLETSMRFMFLMRPNLPQDTDWMPDPADVAAMSRYNDELSKAGVLLALDGLHPPDKGARVRFSGGQGAVTDGPFTEAEEVVGGYWMIQARDKEEAVQWALRCPPLDGHEIEIRQVFEMSDFPEDVQAAANAGAA